MLRYCKWIYPQVQPGKSHKRPIMPDAFLRLVDVTVTWDLAGTDSARAEFWEYDNTHPHAADIEAHYTTYDTIADYELECFDGLTRAAWIAANPPPNP